MSVKTTHIAISLLTAGAALTASCTDEELGTDRGNYMGSIEYSIPQGTADSLYLVCDRIVHFTTYSMAVKSIDGGTGKGRFIYNSPLSGKNNRNLTQYLVRTGPYSVGGVGCSYKDFSGEYIDTIRHGYGSTELTMSQRMYKLSDETLRKALANKKITLSGWTDYNGYTERYVQPLSKPLYRASSEMLYVEKDQVTIMPLILEKRSLTLTINFTIEKDLNAEPFVVQKVETELSGVPFQMELHSGVIPTDSTCKVFYPTKLTKADQYDASKVGCTGTVEIMSLAAPRSPSLTNGPGILQLLIYVKTQSGETRVLHGIVNLHNAIRRASLADYSEDGLYMTYKAREANITITTPCRITAESMTADIIGVSGIEAWQPCGSMIIIESDSQMSEE